MSDEKTHRKASDLPLPGDDFLLFLQSLAGQAAIFLGHQPNPQTGEKMVDLATAQYFIDLLGMLEAKTEGNRTEQEDRFLKDVLVQLRLAFVEAKKKEAGGGEDSSAGKGEEGADGEPRSSAGEGGEEAPSAGGEGAPE